MLYESDLLIPRHHASPVTGSFEWFIFSREAKAAMSNRVLDWVDVELHGLLPGWHESQSGNYWKVVKGKRLVIYWYDGWWRWLIVQGQKKTYGPRGYCDPVSAAGALMTHLGG